MNNKKTVFIGMGIICLLVIIGLTALLIKKFAPNTDRMKLDKYFLVQEGLLPVILEDEQVDAKAILDGKTPYVDIDFVQENLNKRFYWDANENQLIYTTQSAVISTTLNTKDVLNNKSKEQMDYVVAKAEGETTYVALDYVKKFTALDYKIYKKPNRIVIHNVYDKDITYKKVQDETILRTKPTIKNLVLTELKKGDVLRVLEDPAKGKDFQKVITESGITGYAKVADLSKEYKEKSTTDFKEETYTHILMDKKVCIAWQQVTNLSSNGNLQSLISVTKGVNVVSPTWFETIDNAGNISSYASDNYVTQAHNMGLQVWALCSDFGPKMKIGKVLSVTSKRQKLVKNLIAEAIRYSVDGINIDFENVRSENGKDFIQFIRELSILCRTNGLVLSVDNYPPVGSLSDYYDREEQAKVADYVITMGYDEYYTGSEEAGPVSSISYIKNALRDVSNEVPAEQMIMGLPFYSRHWQEKRDDGGSKLSSQACTMKQCDGIIKSSGKKPVWDNETGMNYLEYSEEGIVHKLWIEDAKSLELKLKQVAEAKIGGTAFWKVGQEKASVWNMIAKYSH